MEDTRQKPDKNKHIASQLNKLGHEVVRSKLVVGDYTWATDQSTCVDTKFGLMEVASNLTQGHERFRRECELANKLGIRLVILIQEENIKTLGDVNGWYNWRKKKNPRAISGKQLFKIMNTMGEKYNVTWLFCPKRLVGKYIVEILKGER